MLGNTVVIKSFDITQTTSLALVPQKQRLSEKTEFHAITDMC